MIKTPLSTVIGGAFWTPGVTVIGGNTPTLDQQIQKLFTNNEQGFFYDPNDLSTLFQDSTGTVPVTSIGQPVGLMLDKSGRNNHAYQATSAARPIFRQKPILGSELVVNGDFSNGTTGWAALYHSTISNVNSKLRVTATGANPYAQQVIKNLVVGKSYSVSLGKATKAASGAWVAYLGSTIGIYKTDYSAGISLETGSRQITFTATTNMLNIQLVGGSVTVGDYADFDGVSVKEVTGYRTDQNYLKFDGVDDKLTTTLPTQLTGCTVVRFVPNVGTQILTDQTIPATYEDNKDHCGLIVINRALTPSEASAIAAEFNKRAGV